MVLPEIHASPEFTVPSETQTLTHCGVLGHRWRRGVHVGCESGRALLMVCDVHFRGTHHAAIGVTRYATCEVTTCEFYLFVPSLTVTLKL